MMRKVSSITLWSTLFVCSWTSASVEKCRHWRLDLDGLGNRLFFASDRRFVIPSSLSDLEVNYCKPQLTIIDDVRNIARNCLTPYTKQVAGLLTFGFRKNVRRTCSDVNIKKQMLQKFQCFQNDTTRNLLYSTMTPLITELEFIRDNTHNSSLLLLQTCCSFDYHAKVSYA